MSPVGARERAALLRATADGFAKRIEEDNADTVAVFAAPGEAALLTHNHAPMDVTVLATNAFLAAAFDHDRKLTEIAREVTEEAGFEYHERESFANFYGMDPATLPPRLADARIATDEELAQLEGQPELGSPAEAIARRAIVAFVRLSNPGFEGLADVLNPEVVDQAVAEATRV